MEIFSEEELWVKIPSCQSVLIHKRCGKNFSGCLCLNGGVSASRKRFPNFSPVRKYSVHFVLEIVVRHGYNFSCFPVIWIVFVWLCVEAAKEDVGGQLVVEIQQLLELGGSLFHTTAFTHWWLTILWLFWISICYGNAAHKLIFGHGGWNGSTVECLAYSVVGLTGNILPMVEEQSMAAGDVSDGSQLMVENQLLLEVGYAMIFSTTVMHWWLSTLWLFLMSAFYGNSVHKIFHNHKAWSICAIECDDYSMVWLLAIFLTSVDDDDGNQLLVAPQLLLEIEKAQQWPSTLQNSVLCTSSGYGDASFRPTRSSLGIPLLTTGDLVYQFTQFATTSYVPASSFSCCTDVYSNSLIIVSLFWRYSILVFLYGYLLLCWFYQPWWEFLKWKFKLNSKVFWRVVQVWLDVVFTWVYFLVHTLTRRLISPMCLLFCYNLVMDGDGAKRFRAVSEREGLYLVLLPEIFVCPLVPCGFSQLFSWLVWFLHLLWDFHIAWCGYATQLGKQTGKPTAFKQYFQWQLQGVPTLNRNAVTSTRSCFAEFQSGVELLLSGSGHYSEFLRWKFKVVLRCGELKPESESDICKHIITLLKGQLKIFDFSNWNLKVKAISFDFILVNVLGGYDIKLAVICRVNQFIMVLLQMNFLRWKFKWYSFEFGSICRGDGTIWFPTQLSSTGLEHADQISRMYIHSPTLPDVMRWCKHEMDSQCIGFLRWKFKFCSSVAWCKGKSSWYQYTIQLLDLELMKIVWPELAWVSVSWEGLITALLQGDISQVSLTVMFEGQRILTALTDLVFISFAFPPIPISVQECRFVTLLYGTKRNCTRFDLAAARIFAFSSSMVCILHTYWDLA